MIVNLTQHLATPEQVKSGVVEPTRKGEIQKLLTFDSIPESYDIRDRALKLANIARKELQALGLEDGGLNLWGSAMIGGAPYLMSTLEVRLAYAGIKPLYAFSERVSEEQVQPDGSVRKENVFKHVGFVEV